MSSKEKKEDRKQDSKEGRKEGRKEGKKEGKKDSSPRERDGKQSVRRERDQKSSPREKEQRQSSPRESREGKRSTPRESRSGSPNRSPSPRSPRRGSRGYSTTSLHRERRSANKIYRCPNSPLPDEMHLFEKNFVLDCNAVSCISDDYSKANPKLGQVLTPYNSQKDRGAQAYFRFDGVDRTLKKTCQERPGTSIEGKVADRFHYRGPGFIYLVRRNKDGAGLSPDTVNGHSEFLTDVKPVLSYNGLYGYRRNTPWLRSTPSQFETGRSPVY